MNEEKFLMVSLDEEKAKKLAAVISNESCTKILNYLSDHAHATESDLKKELGIAASTINYNIKQLVAAGLVVSEEYHYSTKGKEVQHYKLANKYIIVAPKKDKSFADKLRALFVMLVVSVSGFFSLNFLQSRSPIIEAAPMTARMVAEESAADMVMAEPVSTVAQEPNIALWFLIISGILILVWIVYELWRLRK